MKKDKKLMLNKSTISLLADSKEVKGGLTPTVTCRLVCWE